MRLDCIDDLDARIKVLREISELKGADEYFRKSHHRAGSATPLEPYTGDGPICDICMLEAAEPKHQPQFEKITLWFVWLCIRYHYEELSFEKYKEYLDSAEGDSRLNTSEQGRRIAAAGCEIRKLGDPKPQRQRDALCRLDLQLNEDHARHLGHLCKLVNRISGIDNTLVQKWAKYSDLTLNQAELELHNMRDGVHYSIRYVLRLLWVPGTGGRGVTSAYSRQQRERRKYLRPRVHRYGELRGHSRPDDDGDGESGIIIDIDKAPGPDKPARKPHKDEQVDHAEDPDDPGGDPIFRIYIGDRCDDHIGSYYASKAAQYVIEYQNAQLPWSKDRLSSQALESLLRSLQPNVLDSDDNYGAKLLVLLSLMTGRSLDAVGKTQIVADASRAKNDSDIQICVTEQTLRLRAATPKLTRSAKKQERRITHDMAEYLTVGLPDIALQLVGDGDWLGDQLLRPKRYLAAAKALIAGLPSHLGIRPALVRDSLVFVLLEQSGGDLGIVKIVTNRQGLNYNNIIHYAAYPESVANKAWGRALEEILDTPFQPRRAPGSTEQAEKYLGTPDAINKDLLCAQLTDLQAKLHERLADSEWIPFHNLFTLYTLLWVNLATASRAQVSPAPVAIIGDIAVVSDKHRDDDSAERLVPLSDGVLAQLRSYFAYVWNLSLRVPKLKPIADAFESGVINFQFINKKGQVVNYRPKWLYQNESLIPMPGNWARKLCRAELIDIGGRFLDAGMGHWTAGRHPYRYTSTLACRHSRAQWLTGQRRLESELGFQVIAHPEVSQPVFEWPLIPALKSMTAPKKVEQESTVVLDFAAECMAADEKLYDAICEADVKEPSAVASLILLIVKKYSADEQHAFNVADTCCEMARKKWRVPVYAQKPRRQFERDWLINRTALHNLAFFTTHIMPGFEADLRNLPRPSKLDCADSIDLGRFVMLCIWRQGLVSWPVLDEFIKSYCTGGILGTDNLRYVPTEIRCRRNGARMGRLNFLEPYCRIYMVAEHARLRTAFEPLFKLNTQQRRAKVQAALVAYLRCFTDITIGHVLTITLKAAQQYHMLEGSPVLAAYATAEFETHDLPENEIRHLAGFAARVRDYPESDLDQPTSVEGGLRRDVADLPGKALDSSRDIVHRIAYKRSPDVREIKHQISQIKTATQLEQLVVAFSLWLLRREIKTVNRRLGGEEKKRFQRILEIVGYSLIGFAHSASEGMGIDENLLVNLEEQFVDLHPNIDPGPGFQVFRKFLRQKSGRAATEKLGFTIGDVEPPTPRGVLAKIVTPELVQQVRTAIDLVRESGIGNPKTRKIAQRHLEFVDLFGLRRTEAERIREKDIQGNLIRVQPYGEHTLKTKWSNRNLPRALVNLAGLDWVNEISASTDRQMIVHNEQDRINGHNFFDSVNKLIQKQAADPETHIHILRHAMASRLMLSMLSEAVDYDKIENQFPWLSKFIIAKDQIDVLLGGEGPGGHGAQAISALLGHSHPTTSLRYYIHTMGVAFYAHLYGLPQVDMVKSFEFRLGNPRTMQRRISAWREETQNLDRTEAFAHVFNALEDHAERLCPHVVSNDTTHLGIDPPVEPTKNDGQEPPVIHPPQITFEKLAALEQVLRGDAPDDGVFDLKKIKVALKAFQEIPTGKRGGKTKRHKLEMVDDIPMPTRLPADSPTRAGAIVCEWLDRLLRFDPEEFKWVLQKWLYHSEREFGRMAMDDIDVQHFVALPVCNGVKLLEEKKTFPGSSSGRKDRVQKFGRIRCTNQDGKPIRRDASAVRWALTWTAALYYKPATLA